MEDKCICTDMGGGKLCRYCLEQFENASTPKPDQQPNDVEAVKPIAWKLLHNIDFFWTDDVEEKDNCVDNQGYEIVDVRYSQQTVTQLQEKIAELKLDNLDKLRQLAYKQTALTDTEAKLKVAEKAKEELRDALKRFKEGFQHNATIPRPSQSDWEQHNLSVVRNIDYALSHTVSKGEK